MSTDLVLDMLNDGKDARVICADCGGYIALVANYDELPQGDFFVRKVPRYVVHRAVEHRCRGSVRP